MSNPVAGWYPDPSGDQRRLRYWDGASWTEHFAPAHGQGQVTADGAGERALGQQPYPQQDGAQAYGQQPYGQYPSSRQPYNQSPYGAGRPDQAGYGQRPGGADDGGSGKGLVIGIILAAVVLVAAAITAVVLLLGGNAEPEPRPVTTPDVTPTAEAADATTTDAPTEGPAPEETDAGQATTSGGELELDTTVAGSGDLTLAVTGGAVEVENSDRSSFLDSGEVGSLDHALGVYLEPGSTWSP